MITQVTHFAVHDTRSNDSRSNDAWRFMHKLSKHAYFT